jgi:hypothetical protein
VCASASYKNEALRCEKEGGRERTFRRSTNRSHHSDHIDADRDRDRGRDTTNANMSVTAGI